MSINIDKYIFSFDDETKKYALEELNESEEVRESSLVEIKKWLLEEQPNLHARTESKYVLPFLRGCKFNMAKTKQKLINYYTMKKNHPEWFKNRNPLLLEISELVKSGVFVPLLSTHENRLVVIIRTAAHDPKRHKQDDVFKAGKMILDIACLENEFAQIYGVTSIFDMTGITFAHYMQMKPSIIRKAVYAWQNYHVRPKQLEFVNAPVYVNVVLNVFKQFMSEKLRGRVRVNRGGNEGMLDIIGEDLLPEEYGGKGESIKQLCDYWYNKLLEYADWFADDEIYKAE